jgi:hypothetical protein
MISHEFDEEYYKDGIRSGRSLYENYRWLPQVSLPMANAIKEIYGYKIVLDYGCAMGFLVHALKLLNVIAYGYDTSDYAIDNCKPEVKEHLFKRKEDIPKNVNLVIVKDVFEHIPYDQIDDEIRWISSICSDMMCIVPFGSDGKYRIHEYTFDRSHLIKEDEEWWSKKFIANGFFVDKFYHEYKGIKENWTDHNKFGNGIFLLKKGA